MGYKYTSRDGKRVEVHVAAAFDRMEADFYAVWGLGLIVADGTRTRSEQADLRQNYLDYLAGGPWAPLAAKPGYSNHEETGPKGPRAIDIWDTGSDAGVTTEGTPRANWIKANAHRYGFNPAGYSFVSIEPWHIEYTGSLTAPIKKPKKEDTDDMIINIKGKKGKRRGGLYYVSGGKATFIGYHAKSAYPLWGNEKEIARLQKVIKGLK